MIEIAIGIFVLFVLWRLLRRGRKTDASKDRSKSHGEAQIGSLWVPANESAKIAGHNIGGMVYVGRTSNAQYSRSIENCLIDPSLPVARKRKDSEGIDMLYWPSYAYISPTARLAYLQWLATGRSTPKADIGYVFLYFYGLECRLLLDDPVDREKAELIAEVKRLRATYSTNNSFDNCSNALLEAATLLSPDEIIPKPEPKKLLERAGYELPLWLKIGIGRKLRSGEALGAEWLLCWWLAHPETRLRTPARRAFDEFTSLFVIRFTEKYPNGLQIRSPKRKLTHRYRAASGTFELQFKEELDWCPDVSRLTRPVKIAARFAEECMDQLNAYSRYLGRVPDGRGTIKAHSLLPDEIAALIPNSEMQVLEADAKQYIKEAEGLAPVDAILERVEGEVVDRVGRKALIGAADALARVSIGVAPDPRFAIRMPKKGEPVVLFPLPQQTTKLEEVGPDYSPALLTIVLGTLIAHADGTVSMIERDRLKGHIDKLASLSASERARLHANLKWMVAIPPSLSLLRRRCQGLTQEQRQVLGRMAIAVAGADGMIDPAEVKAVQKFYRVMGLPEDRVFGDLHEMSAAPSTKPVTIIKPETQGLGYAIPKPPEEEPLGGPKAVTLNAARVAAIKADTQVASDLLSGIFETEELEENDGRDDNSSDEYEGLDTSHAALVDELLKRGSWSKGDFTRLVEGHGLMPGGAQETINEWAYELAGDALLEEDDEELMINREIIEELQSDS